MENNLFVNSISSLSLSTSLNSIPYYTNLYSISHHGKQLSLRRYTMMYMTDSISSLLDLLFPRQEFRLAKRKFPENLRTYYFSEWFPESSIYVWANPKSIKQSKSVSRCPIKIFSSLRSLCTNPHLWSSLKRSIYNQIIQTF